MAPKRVRRLRPHQNVGVECLVTEKNPWMSLVMPTAAGKTVTIQVALTILLREKRIRGAIILTPQEHIEDTFLQPGCWKYTAQDGTTQVVAVVAEDFIHVRKVDAKALFSDLSEAEGKIIVMTHAKAVQLLRDGQFPKGNLTGWVVSTDESHHNGKLATKLDEFNALVQSLGGAVWTVTASPFRSDGRPVAPLSARTLTFGYSSIAASGHLPKQITFLTVALERENRPHGEVLTSDIEAVSKFVIDSGRETVIRIQRGSIIDDEEFETKAKPIAERYMVALTKYAERIGLPTKGAFLQAVGQEDSIKVAINRCLLEEREIARGPGYGHHKLKVVVSCQRFGEGADWPSCSQVVSVGIPTTLQGFIQLLGRGARSKRGIKNFPQEWVEEVKFIAFTPTLDLDTDKDYRKARALLLAAAVECDEVICDFLHLWRDFVHNFRLPPEIRPRPGLWEDLNDIDPETEAKAKLVGVEATVAIETILGTQPTLKQVVRKLRSWGMGLHEIRAVIQSLFVENKEIREAAQETLRKAFEAAVGRVAAAGNGPGSVDIPTLKRAFDEELLAGLLSVAERFPDLAVQMDKKLLSKFTGATAGSVAVIDHKSLPVMVAALAQERDMIYDVPDDQVMERVILPYLKYNKALPNPKTNGKSGAFTAEIEARLNIRQIDAALRRRGRLDLYRMSVCDPEWILGPPLDLSMISPTLQKRLQNLSREGLDTPNGLFNLRVNQSHLVKVNGRTEHLVGLILAKRYGWRGLTARP